MGKLENYASKTAATLRVDRRPDWMKVAALGAIPALLIYVVIASFSDPEPAPQTIEQPAYEIVDTSSPEGSDPTTGDEPTVAPAAEGETVNLPKLVGQGTQATPKGAYDAALALMRAMTDPTQADNVPTVDGSAYPAPAVAYPKGAVKRALVDNSTADTVTFVMTFDPDSAGPMAAQSIPVESVRKDDGTWGVVPPGN